MLTQEELAELLHAQLSTVTILRELNIIPAIKTGRNYMFPIEEVKIFQQKYRGKDVSNKVKAIQSYKEVEQAPLLSKLSYGN